MEKPYPPFTDDEIKTMYNEAVLHFRNKMEKPGANAEEALRETIVECTLGLNHIAWLEREVRERYGDET